jgi:hypothetical protein
MFFIGRPYRNPNTGVWNDPTGITAPPSNMGTCRFDPPIPVALTSTWNWCGQRGGMWREIEKERVPMLERRRCEGLAYAGCMGPAAGLRRGIGMP